MPTQSTVQFIKANKGEVPKSMNKYRAPRNVKERLLARMAKTKGFGVKARSYSN